jgi:hypothetical protein
VICSMPPLPRSSAPRAPIALPCRYSALAIAAALVIAVVMYNLVLPGPSNVAGPSLSPQPASPGPSPRESAGPTAAPDPDRLLGWFSDRNDDPRSVPYPPNPDLVSVAIRFLDGDLVFSMRFAQAFPARGHTYIVIADPDTLPPHGPAPGAVAPYCSAYEGLFVVWFDVATSTARLISRDVEADTESARVPIEAIVDGRDVVITVPATWVAEIRALAPDDPLLAFSIAAILDPETTGWDDFPDTALECATLDLSSE